MLAITPSLGHDQDWKCLATTCILLDRARILNIGPILCRKIWFNRFVSPSAPLLCMFSGVMSEDTRYCPIRVLMMT